MPAATVTDTNTATEAAASGTRSRRALLRLLQLASPALPVGAYAYSQALEHAVEQGWVGGEADARGWLLGLLAHTQTRLDVPVLARLQRGWQHDDAAAIRYWNERHLSQDIPPPSDELRRALAEYFADDMRALAEALGRDRLPWPSWDMIDAPAIPSPASNAA